MVKAGEVLCEIDPRTYQAQLDAALGQLQATQAKYELAKTENERSKDLYKENPKAISLKALDQHQASEDAAAAEVVAAKSTVEVYRLNVEFTKVTSPISGRVGRYQFTIGNLVTENATTLTTVVSQDPIYVYFNIDEQTMLSLARGFFEGKLPPLSSRQIKVDMGLQDESGFPHQGTADFADNVVDPTTGTLTMRASFDNPVRNGVRLLLPGMFVRMRIPLGRPQQALLVADQAVGTDQTQKYVYVVDAAGTVQYRRVQLGSLQPDGLRVVTDGIAAGDQVIVSGLQLVQPTAKVKTEVVQMPSTPAAESTGGSPHDTEGESAGSDTTGSQPDAPSVPGTDTTPDAKSAPATKTPADGASKSSDASSANTQSPLPPESQPANSGQPSN